MYSVRFLGVDKTGAHIELGISCPHYAIHNNNNGVITITTYAFMADTIGVDRCIYSADTKAEKGNTSPSFDVCYIENDRGKTVKTIGQRK
ncbi:MAG TPA: hypothetical protein EYN67_13650 [Flavobacteriales bacterium]|nr:hypothetical protein [Flavobacteriales bacterium]